MTGTAGTADAATGMADAMLVLSPTGWVTMVGVIAVLWGTAVWALYRSLSDEDEKLELIERQGEMDTYSSRALAELRERVTANPEAPLADEGKKATERVCRNPPTGGRDVLRLIRRRDRLAGATVARYRRSGPKVLRCFRSLARAR
jgi:hypothetical protein